MYSTKSTHPKLADGYLCIGDTYVKSRTTDSRFKSAQFQTIPPKRGQTEGFFSAYEYGTHQYQDSNQYRLTQKRDSNQRPSGFGSSDAFRRDEFTLHIRAQQWKELLDKESHFNRMYAVRDKTRPPSLLEKYNARTKSANTHYPRPPNSARSATRPRPGGRNLPDLFQSRVPRYLYDIGRESGTTPICNKCKAETFYCKHRIGNGAMTARRVGNLKTSAMVIGSNRPNTVAKPSFGRKSHIKAFYDSGHIRTH